MTTVYSNPQRGGLKGRRKFSTTIAPPSSTRRGSLPRVGGTGVSPVPVSNTGKVPVPPKNINLI